MSASDLLFPSLLQDQKISEIAYFANEVMRPLLGEIFVRPVRIGGVNEHDFEMVKLEVPGTSFSPLLFFTGVISYGDTYFSYLAQAQPFRPLSRCKKDINSRRVILSPDCVFLTPEFDVDTAGDTFSVEIKPKQGWHSLKATCAVDLCHRCLKQHAKVFRGEIDNISAYCPLDLFSGDLARMKRALFDLYENPNNRFKLFRNGRTIYTESIGQLRDAEEAMTELFLGNCRVEAAKSDGSGQGALDMLAALLCSALLAPLEEGTFSLLPIATGLL